MNKHTQLTKQMKEHDQSNKSSTLFMRIARMLKGTEVIAHRTTQGKRAEAEADGRCRWQEASGHLAQAQIGTAGHRGICGVAYVVNFIKA